MAGGRRRRAGKKVASSSDQRSSAPSSSSSSSLSAVGLADLPFDCLLRIMSALSALDVCRMARVCRLLQKIADSDEVWTWRLPSHPAINRPFISKKDLYFRLRAGMVHKDLSQPYWLDPETGEGAFVMSARDLVIVWGNRLDCWQWKHQAGSWFAESACMQRVYSLQVTGEFEAMFVPGSYTVSFRLKCPEDHWSGWSRLPVNLFLSSSNGDHIQSERILCAKKNSKAANPAALRSSHLSSWMELDIGEFVVFQEKHVKLIFGMIETVSGLGRGNLILDCVKVQPTHAISRNV